MTELGVAQGLSVREQLARVVERRERVPGVGGPVLGPDERNAQVIQLVDRFGRDSGPSWRLAWQVDDFFHRLRLRMRFETRGRAPRYGTRRRPALPVRSSADSGVLLSAAVGHEINNPLSVALGLLLRLATCGRRAVRSDRLGSRRRNDRALVLPKSFAQNRRRTEADLVRQPVDRQVGRLEQAAHVVAAPADVRMVTLSTYSTSRRPRFRGRPRARGVLPRPGGCRLRLAHAAKVTIKSPIARGSRTTFGARSPASAHPARKGTTKCLEHRSNGRHVDRLHAARTAIASCRTSSASRPRAH